MKTKENENTDATRYFMNCYFLQFKFTSSVSKFMNK